MIFTGWWQNIEVLRQYLQNFFWWPTQHSTVAQAYYWSFDQFGMGGHGLDKILACELGVVQGQFFVQGFFGTHELPGFKVELGQDLF